MSILYFGWKKLQDIGIYRDKNESQTSTTFLTKFAVEHATTNAPEKGLLDSSTVITPLNMGLYF